jgi:pyruvate dehydrogenase E2 component (dihydrolipoamide acetyltransferase)
MGADMTEGTVIKWMKQVGDEVPRGDIIAEIETDKANIALEASESGSLVKIIVGEGETVPVGETIALIGSPDEDVTEPTDHKTARKPVERSPETPEAAEQSRELRRSEREAEADSDGQRIRISPVARRIAHQNDFDYRHVKGTGPGGRILRRGIEQAIAAETGKPAREEGVPAAAGARTTSTAEEHGMEGGAPEVGAPQDEPIAEAARASEAREAGARMAEPERQAAPPRAPARPERREEPAPVEGLSRIRRTIARRMTQSKQEQPHYYLTLDVDMTDAMDFRKQINASLDDEHRVSVNDLVIKACALALERHPKFNAEFSEDGLIMHEDINIDLGVALDEGLIAVSVLDTAHKSLGSIAREAKDVIERARDNRLRPEQYGNGTFTITNLGAYGVETLIGIINPPQAAILGVGTVMPQPVVRNNEIVVRQVMKIALSADHRVSDGAEGARFIKEIQGFLEQPALLVL